ncbi:MAG: bifunctional riboflavin kinase/FAD synthetase [Candidatus Omnitrophica bacterium]|nr:bifunctional riboflavin kinase/FAD synthetase [Candidatus Omnitrophota bacterium]
MKVIYKKLPSRRVNCVATIGTFDGIHKGHKFILDKVIKSAQRRKVSSLAITFDLAPQQFLRRKHLHNTWRSTKAFSGILSDLEQKIGFVQPLGIDFLWFLKTRQRLLELSPEAFLGYIFSYFSIKELIVGEDFRFGYAGGGDVSYLKKVASEFGFKLTVIAKTKFKQELISSSLIRHHIRSAELKKVKQLLGRDFSLKGKVVKGRGIGRQLKFPTANISAGDYVVPPRGVYAAYVILNKQKYLAAVNIGRSPTLTSLKKCIIEAYFINFSKNILGKTIEIVFLKRLRDERKFSNSPSLQSAIAKDVRQITSKYSIPS